MPVISVGTENSGPINLYYEDYGSAGWPTRAAVSPWPAEVLAAAAGSGRRS